jgi:hypothetical protein
MTLESPYQEGQSYQMQLFQVSMEFVKLPAFAISILS